MSLLEFRRRLTSIVRFLEIFFGFILRTGCASSSISTFFFFPPFFFFFAKATYNDYAGGDTRYVFGKSANALLNFKCYAGLS